MFSHFYTVGVDYHLLSDSIITLRPGMATSCLRVQIVDDLIAENSEAFRLTLETDDERAVIIRPNTTVLILDNDCKL